MKTYAANELNQYTAIANPAAVGLRGDATNTAVVTVNGNAVERDRIASDTVPWHFALEADNANGPDYTFAEIVGVINPAGTNEADIVSTTSGSVYAPPQNETLTYDDDGNMLSDGRWTYTWNGENWLVCAEEHVCPTNRTLRKVDYAYDHQGRMVWKEIKHRDAEAQSWEEEKAVSYLWDGYNILAETVSIGSSSSTTYNIWGLDLDGTVQGAGGLGGLLAVYVAGGDDPGLYIPAFDANGNIMEYVSDDGTIVAHREFDPFGGTVVATGDADTFTHWFSTKPWCSVTGLSEYQFRKYSPSVGRWLNRDPIGEGGGANLYRFCRNDGKNKVDVLGENTIWFKESDPVEIPVNDRSIIGPDGLGRTIPTFKHAWGCKELVNGNPRCWVANITLTMNVVSYILVNSTRTNDGIAKTRRHEDLHRKGFSDAFKKYEALYAPILKKIYISQNGGGQDCLREVKEVYKQVEKEWEKDLVNEEKHKTPAWDKWKEEEGLGGML